MAVYHVTVEELPSMADRLCAGNEVYLTGTVYTARDAAHKRLKALMDENKPLPIPLAGACIYYAGPTPERPGTPIGSCGPTTSSRMDGFAPSLYDRGMIATIGKGNRSDAVAEAIRRNHAVYFCAIGGAGALAARSVVSCEIIAFPELGCESVKKLTVREFPVYVGLDSHGGSLFAGE